MEAATDRSLRSWRQAWRATVERLMGRVVTIQQVQPKPVTRCSRVVRSRPDTKADGVMNEMRL